MKPFKESREVLFQIGQILKNDQIEIDQIKEAIDRYKELMNELSVLDLNDEPNKENLSFENGTAIGPTWAAMCLDDLKRTQQFVKGVFEAVEDLFLKRNTTHPIHVLYAGTGPYASLILPVLATYSESEIQVTLVEVNPESFRNVLQVFERLNFEGYIRTALEVDASSYEFSEAKSVDIVLSETMQRALDKEPQVSIFLNLQNKFGDGVVLIPEQVILSLGLSKPCEEFDSNPALEYDVYGSVFSLNKNTIRECLDQSGLCEKDVQFEKVTKTFTNHLSRKRVFPVIITEIQIYKDTWLLTNQSGLTIPKQMGLDIGDQEIVSIDFQYEITGIPELKYSIF